ncbi:MAG: tRNA lysidine(34) synthetase TilS [Alphaproteobacteria bacterium]|jgi:tRNA(Ile)-lysidine synthase|nr:tRNA lysidine(34) synthetase TilS [Alphaproteobacteria bacterium]
MTIYSTFSKRLEGIFSENNLSKKDTVAIAVSGGSDSMALALLSKKWADKNSVNLSVINVDHSLRKSSAKESRRVSSWMDKLGIKNVILKYNGKIPTSNIEAVAREYRYDLIKKYCDEHGIKTIFVGHNLNEKTETFYLNLIRGSGLYGLSGIKEYSKRNDLNIVRPLMDVSKLEIKKYLKDQRQKWIEDPSNKDEKYLRVKVRNLKKIFSKLGLEDERLSNTISSLQKVRSAIEFYTEEAFKKIIKKDNGITFLDAEEYKKYPEEIQLRFLSKVLTEFSKKDYAPRIKKIENLHVEILNNFKNKKAMTLSGCKFTKKTKEKILIDLEKKN